MRILSILSGALAITLLASCARVVPPPRPAPRPAPVPLPAPAPSPPPAATDWRDAPVTPGNWRYSGGIATFGTAGAPQFTIACAGDRRVRLTRVTSGAGAMTVRTTSLSRVLATDAAGVAVLAASDPLLDARGYSGGRFVVEMAVQPTLIVAAWAEVLRVVEDCRG